MFQLSDSLLSGRLSGAAMALAFFSCSFVPATAQTQAWVQYRHPDLGFSLRYPAHIFAPDDNAEVSNGRMFQTTEKDARLIVGAFSNETRMSLRAYRQFVLTQTYPNSEIDYSPVRKRWFVLSGVVGDKTFYQRVAFTCGGKLINSWAMVYPTSKKRLFDRIVERVHKTYVPARGVAACAQADKLQ